MNEDMLRAYMEMAEKTRIHLNFVARAYADSHDQRAEGMMYPPPDPLIGQLLVSSRSLIESTQLDPRATAEDFQYAIAAGMTASDHVGDLAMKAARQAERLRERFDKDKDD